MKTYNIQNIALDLIGTVREFVDQNAKLRALLNKGPADVLISKEKLQKQENSEKLGRAAEDFISTASGIVKQLDAPVISAPVMSSKKIDTILHEVHKGVYSVSV